MLLTIVVGLFLIAHGLVHLLYFVRAEPDFPMSAGKSWLVTRAGLSLSIVRPLVAVLAVIGMVGFCLLALSFWGQLVPEAWFQVLAIVAASASLLLVAITWHKTFVFSVLINAGILVWALVFN